MNTFKRLLVAALMIMVFGNFAQADKHNKAKTDTKQSDKKKHDCKKGEECDHDDHGDDHDDEGHDE